ncbi:uncharacterized protein LOC144369172 [Ictidomys tridecemlineatus]
MLGGPVVSAWPAGTGLGSTPPENKGEKRKSSGRGGLQWAGGRGGPERPRGSAWQPWPPAPPCPALPAGQAAVRSPESAGRVGEPGTWPRQCWPPRPRPLTRPCPPVPLAQRVPVQHGGEAVGGAQCLPQLALPVAGQSSPGLRVTPRNPGNKPILLPRWDPQRRPGVGCRGGPGPWAAWHPSKPPPPPRTQKQTSFTPAALDGESVCPSCGSGPSCVVRKHSRCPAKVSKPLLSPQRLRRPRPEDREFNQPQQCQGPLRNAARPDSKDMKRAGTACSVAESPGFVPGTQNGQLCPGALGSGPALHSPGPWPTGRRSPAPPPSATAGGWSPGPCPRAAQGDTSSRGGHCTRRECPVGLRGAAGGDPDTEARWGAVPSIALRLGTWSRGGREGVSVSVPRGASPREAQSLCRPIPRVQAPVDTSW